MRINTNDEVYLLGLLDGCVQDSQPIEKLYQAQIAKQHHQRI